MIFDNPIVVKKGGAAEMLTINLSNTAWLFYNLPSGTVLPEEVSLSLPSATTLERALWQTASFGLKKLTLKIPNACTFSYFMYKNMDLEELNFIDGVTTKSSLVGFLGYPGNHANKLKKVTGTITLANYSNLNDIISAPLLEEIHFAQDCITMSVSFANCPKLNEESLASIGNALNASNPNTLTLHADSKSKCQNEIFGTVSGGVFTIDPNGSVSLYTFITDSTMKGWTIP